MFDPKPTTPAPPVVTEEPPSTREQRRSRRKREVRARTISVKRLTKRELELGRMLYPEDDYERPKTRADCASGPRPCPFVSCMHHLYLDVSSRTGAIKLNFPDLEVEDMKESCVLDVTDRGDTTLEGVGAIMNLTRERVRQLEAKALPVLRPHLERLGGPEAFGDWLGGDGKRRLPIYPPAQLEPSDLEDELTDDDGNLNLDAPLDVSARVHGNTLPVHARPWYAVTLEAIDRISARTRAGCRPADLAAEMGVSVVTVADRLRALRLANVVEKVAHGTYVRAIVSALPVAAE